LKTAYIATACATAALSVAVVSTGGGSATALGPSDTVMASVEALQENDLESFLRLTAGDGAFSEMEQEWNRERSTKPSQEEAREFAETMAKLVAPGAEKELEKELLPELEEMRPQMAMMSAMIGGMGQAALAENDELTPAERQQASALIGALATLMQDEGVTSEENLRRAIGIVCSTARQLELKTLDDVRGLSFTQLLGKGGVALGGVKDLLDVYGLDLEAFLDSVEAETTSENGNSATVRVSFEILGSASSVDTQMVLRDGRWTRADA